MPAPAESTHALIEWLDGRRPDVAKIGGKAASLDRLAGFGFRIPPGFCLTTDAFALQVATLPGGERLATDPAQLGRRGDARGPRRRDACRTPGTGRRGRPRRSARAPDDRARRGPRRSPATRRPLVGRGRGRRRGLVRGPPRHRARPLARRRRARRPPLLGVAVERPGDRLSHAARPAPRWRRDGGRRPGARPGRSPRRSSSPAIRSPAARTRSS